MALATLVSGTIRPHEPREGLEYNFDFRDVMTRLFTLGFYRVGWEGVDSEAIPWTASNTRYEWKFSDPAAGHRSSGVWPVGRRGPEILLVVGEDENPSASPARADGASSFATLEVRIRRDGAEVEPRPARVYLRWTDSGYEVAALEH